MTQQVREAWLNAAAVAQQTSCDLAAKTQAALEAEQARTVESLDRLAGQVKQAWQVQLVRANQTFQDLTLRTSHLLREEAMVTQKKLEDFGQQVKVGIEKESEAALERLEVMSEDAVDRSRQLFKLEK